MISSKTSATAPPQPQLPPVVRTAVWLGGTWAAVESLTVLAAGGGKGPLVPVVANDEGTSDVHTQRFAALLATLVLLNGCAVVLVVSTTRWSAAATTTIVTRVHTVLVADALAVGLCGVVECLHGDVVAIVWHVFWILAFGWLLWVRRDEWDTHEKPE